MSAGNHFNFRKVKNFAKRVVCGDISGRKRNIAFIESRIELEQLTGRGERCGKSLEQVPCNEAYERYSHGVILLHTA